MSIYRSCRYCGKSVSGRVDKKYCDDQCRSNYHNRIRDTTRDELRNINSILLRNWKILSGVVMENGETYILRSRLDDEGFDFRYHTEVCTTERGSTYRFCYDYAYCPVDPARVRVLKRDYLQK